MLLTGLLRHQILQYIVLRARLFEITQMHRREVELCKHQTESIRTTLPRKEAAFASLYAAHKLVSNEACNLGQQTCMYTARRKLRG